MICVVALGFSLSQGQTQGSVTELKYALFTSGPLGGFDSSGAVPAIEIAEDMLNQNNSVLSGYRLTHTDVVDTRVSEVKQNTHIDACVYLKACIR